METQHVQTGRHVAELSSGDAEFLQYLRPRLEGLSERLEIVINDMIDDQESARRSEHELDCYEEVERLERAECEVKQVLHRLDQQGVSTEDLWEADRVLEAAGDVMTEILGSRMAVITEETDTDQLLAGLSAQGRLEGQWIKVVNVPKNWD